MLSWPERPEEGEQAPSRIYRAALEAHGGRGGAARGGALRAGRGPALHLPDAPRRGARGVVEGGLGDLGDAPRHDRRRQPRGRPLPRAGQARGADPEPGRRVGARGAGGDQRAARQGRHAGAADRDRGLGARSPRDRLRARARHPPRAGRRAPRAVAGAVPAAAQGRARPLGLRHRPLPDLPAEVQVRARLRDPAGADDQPALRDPHPPGPGALPRRGAARRLRRATSRSRPRPAGWSGC